jgi:hypothetical protein
MQTREVVMRERIEREEAVTRIGRGKAVTRERIERREKKWRGNDRRELENSDSGVGGPVRPYDELWRRDNRADWTPELVRADTAFEQLVQ